jgi:hypothetical protein
MLTAAPALAAAVARTAFVLSKVDIFGLLPRTVRAEQRH